jgi:hypothetical protein
MINLYLFNIKIDVTIKRLGLAIIKNNALSIGRNQATKNKTT